MADPRHFLTLLDFTPAELQQLLTARHRPEIERMLATEHGPYARKWLEELDRAAGRQAAVEALQ